MSLEDIKVVSHDTDLTPVDLGAYSSRITYMAGIAAQDAGRKMGTRLREAAAKAWGVSPDSVRIAPGFVYDKSDSSRSISTKEAMILAEADGGLRLPRQGSSPLWWRWTESCRSCRTQSLARCAPNLERPPRLSPPPPGDACPFCARRPEQRYPPCR